MAKEVDLKKVELKVNVNCCDGCKRKVKKVLQSVEGVLKTEIDPLQPKVTVLGNVDPKILIKKLQRCGKQAEIRITGSQNAGKQNKEMDAAAVAKEREKSKSGCEQAKCSESGATLSEKPKESSKGGDGGENRDAKKEQKDSNSNSCINTTCSTSLKVTRNENSPLPPQVNFTMHPSVLHETGNSIRSCTQHCCMVEPCAITLPYYTIHSYTAPAPTLVPTCCSQGVYNLERPVFQPPLPTPQGALVGDYFSVENTVGCSVM